MVPQKICSQLGAMYGRVMNSTKTFEQTPKSKMSGLALAAIPLGILLNLGIGTIATAIKAPIYADAIGTILMTLLLGMRAGIIVGVASFVLGGFLTNPALPYFSGTQACIAIYVGVIAARGGLRNKWLIIASGIGLGILAAIVSAPIIVWLFGGITGSGVSVVTAFMIASGKSVLKSVILAGAAAEPIDKTIQLFVAIWILRGLPQSLLAKFTGGSLVQNGFLRSTQ
jgi:energy-coupling factor transport system substrate-specific component